MTRETVTKLIREGRHLAEVEVEQFEDELGWSPYLTLEGVQKLDAVRLALRTGDMDKASSLATIYELKRIELAQTAAE
jgi:hypothetical protein